MFGQRHRSGGGNDKPAPAWPRQKMLALLIAAGLTTLALLIGLVLAVVYAVHPSRDAAVTSGTTRTPTSTRSGGGGGGAARSGGARAATDPRGLLADKAMPPVGDDASHPGPVSAAGSATTIVVPAATATGPAQVPTGFPHTPAGALAQMAAIDQVALESGSLAGARSVIAHWALPGGPTANTWSLVHALITLFNETGVSGGSGQLALVLTPVMGEIKGTVGPDFVVPCVDFELDITLQQTARGADADCQRMVWNRDPAAPGGAGGRWMIGPGSEPADPPSVWPDTDTALAVGYHDLRTEPRS